MTKVNFGMPLLGNERRAVSLHNPTICSLSPSSLRESGARLHFHAGGLRCEWECHVVYVLAWANKFLSLAAAGITCR